MNYQERARRRFSTKGKIVKITPAGSSDVHYPASADVEECMGENAGRVRMNVPLSYGMPNMSELPYDVGSIVVLSFFDGRDDCPFVSGYFPDNLKKHDPISPSEIGERRSVLGQIIDIFSQDGAQYHGGKSYYELMVMARE